MDFLQKFLTRMEVRLLAAMMVLAAGFWLTMKPGTIDVSFFWLRWTELMRANGWAGGYVEAASDYPPASFLFLHVVGKISRSLGMDNHLLLKTAISACGLISVIVLHLWQRNFWLTLGFAAALLLNSSAHGYLDAVCLPPFLLCLWALEKRCLGWAGLLYALSVFTKWQPLILAPLLVIHAAGWQRNNAGPWALRFLNLGKLAAGALPVLLLFFLLIPPAEIMKAFGQATQHAALSYQALNLNWIIQHVQYQQAGHAGSGLLPFHQGLPLPLLLWPRRVFYILYGGLLLLCLWRNASYRGFLWFSLAGFLTYCVISNGVHENHFFLVMILAFLAGPQARPAAWAVTAFAAVSANVNLYVFYGLDGVTSLYLPPFTSGPVNGFLLVWSALNFLFLVYCWVECFRGDFRAGGNRPALPSGPGNPPL